MYKKFLLINLFFIVLLIFLIGCSSQEQSNITNNSSNYSSNKIEDNLFDYLEINNITTDYDGFNWYKIKGKIKNTYSKTLNGYIRVSVLNNQMNIIDSKLLSLPVGGLKPGESFIFDKSISQKPFSSYKFSDESISIE